MQALRSAVRFAAPSIRAASGSASAGLHTTRMGADALLGARALSPFKPSTLMPHAASPLAPLAAVPFVLKYMPPSAAIHASPAAANKQLAFDERVANINEVLKEVIQAFLARRVVCSNTGALYGQGAAVMDDGFAKHTTVIAFNDRVELLAETTPIVDFQELLDLAVETGMTRGEGEELINCMASAGVLLRFHDAVYLRPSEVVDAIVAQMPLPTGGECKLVQQYEDKLQACKEELGPLEQQMSKVHSSANSSARFYLWAGLFLLVFQLAAFIRLTFWELSWDVMEPIGFFVQLGTGILAYAWFMFYGMDMSYDNMYNKFYGSARSKKIRGMETLVEKHQQLIKHMHLYEKFLRWAKK